MRQVSAGLRRIAGAGGGGNIDLHVRIGVIKRFEFVFESACSDVQVASDVTR